MKRQYKQNTESEHPAKSDVFSKRVCTDAFSKQRNLGYIFVSYL